MAGRKRKSAAEKSKSTTVALYDKQVAIVEAVMVREHRGFSEAVRHMIETYDAEHGQGKGQGQA